MVVLYPLLSPSLGGEPTPIIERIQLCVSGWVGFVGIGTIFNLALLLLNLLKCGSD